MYWHRRGTVAPAPSAAARSAAGPTRPTGRGASPGRPISSLDFFSFGTNDLTQTAFGISRDDTEGGFLIRYLQEGILDVRKISVASG